MLASSNTALAIDFKFYPRLPPPARVNLENNGKNVVRGGRVDGKDTREDNTERLKNKF